MNFQQLEYILAVEQERNFQRAAEHCHVTQPTLSMMIKKLEQELEIIIFDRSRSPVQPTPQGKKIIEQARIILSQQRMMRNMARDESTQLNGKIRIGIIPTLAAYLVPRFLGTLLNRLPDLRLTIEETNTELIIEQLKKGQLDLGILATPLNETYIEEHPLFYEEFFVYSPSPSKKSYLAAEEINPHELLLLEEGHCLRTQVVRLCQLRQQIEGQLTYQSGSLETLRRLVEQAQGLTVLPELMTLEFSADRKACLSQFQRPAPVREISLVHHQSFGRKKLREMLGQTILEGLPKHLQERDTFQLIEL